MLVTFSGDTHKHLISLLATYQQGNEYYLIFPWACGDLRTYWRDINPQPVVDCDTSTWMAEECYGIARGLYKIHQHETAYFRSAGNHPFAPKEPISSRSRNGSLKLFGRHGDIKPQNVLCFDSGQNEPARPILKITDLGLAEFKTSIANIYKSSSKISTTAAYRPPECDTENGRVGQSHDIWALGCLYLEMIAWILGGWNLVQEFEQLRITETTGPRFPGATEGTFFKVKSISEDGTWKVVVKPTVTKVSQFLQGYLSRSLEITRQVQFIERLRRLPACTKYLHEFLDLIEQEMLVIKPTDPAENGRISAAALAFRLGAMRKLCTST